MLWGVSVVRFDDRLGVHRHEMNGAVCEIDYLFRMSNRPTRILGFGDVTRIGCHTGIAPLQ